MSERIIIRDVTKAMGMIEKVNYVQRNHLIRYNYAVAQTKPGDQVLDIACGSGYGSKLLAFEGCNVTGVDVAQEALDLCKEYNDHDNIRWLRGDIRNVKKFFDEKQFDVIVCFETLEHISDGQEEIVAGFSKILKDDGILVASIPLNHPDEVWHKRKFTFDQRDKLFGDVFPHVAYPEANASLVVCRKAEWTGDQWVSLAAAAKLDELKQESHDFAHGHCQFCGTEQEKLNVHFSRHDCIEIYTRVALCDECWKILGTWL